MGQCENAIAEFVKSPVSEVDCQFKIDSVGAVCDVEPNRVSILRVNKRCASRRGNQVLCSAGRHKSVVSAARRSLKEEVPGNVVERSPTAGPKCDRIPRMAHPVVAGCVFKSQRTAVDGDVVGDAFDGSCSVKGVQRRIREELQSSTIHCSAGVIVVNQIATTCCQILDNLRASPGLHHVECVGA